MDLLTDIPSEEDEPSFFSQIRLIEIVKSRVCYMFRHVFRTSTCVFVQNLTNGNKYESKCPFITSKFSGILETNYP